MHLEETELMFKALQHYAVNSQNKVEQVAVNSG